jgi:hypothetical protein
MRRWIIITLLLILAACQPEPEAPPRPTVIPFPTATPGSMVSGFLPTPILSGSNPAFANPAANLFNPPTAVASRQEVCPARDPSATLSPRPEEARDIIDEILRYLSAGGSPDDLETALRDDWQILGDDGFVLGELDFSGRGGLDVLIGYIDPDIDGTFFIAGCQNQQYIERYRFNGDGYSAPQALTIGDINNDGQVEAAFAFTACRAEDEGEEGEEPENCRYLLQVVSWQPRVERFVSLISGGLEVDELPEIVDTDDDAVRELLFRLTYLGDITTGPLRTGLKIYDWDGSEYVLSIAQPDAPRYRIQIIHEADRYFIQRRMADAIRLYQRTLTDEDLRIWLRNETPTLEAYTLYRMLLARAFSNDPDAEAVYERLILPNVENPDAAPPIYVELGRTFWEIYQITGNVSEACADVRAVVRVQPNAVDFLNRYGDRNPTYTEQDICPF